MYALSLELPPDLNLHVSEDEFAAIAAANRDLRLERTATGELIVTPPAGGESSQRNLSISAPLWIWAQANETLGVAFESSVGFTLPNGSIRGPDASWIKRDRWESLTAEERRKFAPICPDFVVELRSPSDRLSTVQEKMREYIDNGARLGWLIDPQNQRVEIYRSGKEVEVLEKPDRLSGEDVLPDFTLELRRIW